MLGPSIGCGRAQSQAGRRRLDTFPQQEAGHMEYRVLGRSGIRASVVGFGAWGIGADMWEGSDDDRSLAALHAALEAGCTFIDTALAYGDGHSEQLVARALSSWKR